MTCVASALVLVAGCASTARQAPVVERAPAAPKSGTRPSPAPKTSVVADADTRSEFYIVKKGDTLYTIALDHGLDYKELAEWNSLDNPNVIRIGQQLRLRGPMSTGVVTAPLRTAPAAEARPVTGSTASAPTVASGESLKSQPKAIKLPYSDQAFAQLSVQPPARPAVSEPARVEPRPVEKPGSDDDDERIEWAWPVGGKLITAFNESASLKGIGIAGKAGQPVLASAPGKVLYSGDGIRGYGKLVIIKHNKAFLSVYAHNSAILVKEGQNVAKGQKIAEMGNSDSAETKLHFEIRRFGKPVDPIRFLPERPA